MHRPAILLSILASLAAHGADFKIGAHTFTIPDGFEIDVVAGPPLVDRPISMAFDESGALYVSDSSGTNDKLTKQLEDKPHKIVRLVDKNGDGRFDSRTVFVDRLMFPEGTMWLDGSLYVAAPPQIWKFTDIDGDGVAEKQEVWFDGKTLTGCGNDLHGPYAGPDGYIYWCKGAFADQRHRLADGKELVTKASHIFRARPDGSGLESVLTGGMDNPVDVVFTPAGERLLSGTFFVHPGGGQRDGILHAVLGGVWGKDHAVLDGHRRTGELMPIMTHLGPAAASGLELRRAGNWGPEWQGNVFACQFNLRKVSRHILRKDGATFATTDSDFVVSDQADFHPTDVAESPDGSLLIADTGGWYKLCCPTSQLHKPDVLGAIYRVRKKVAPFFNGGSDSAPLLDPGDYNINRQRGSPAELAKELGYYEPFICDRAMAELAKAGDAAVAPVASWLNTPRPGQNATPVQARLNAIWTLTRIDSPNARAAVRFAFADGDPTVRAAAAQSAGLWRDAGASEALINHLKHADLHLRRSAVEALGRIGNAKVAPALAGALTGTNDRFLEHAVAYALIELRAVDAARAILAAKEPSSIRVGLITLHELGALTADDMVPQLASADGATNRLAQWIASLHADWADKLGAWVKSRISSAKGGEIESLQTLLSQMTSSSAMQGLLAELASNSTEPTARRVAFGAMQQSGLKQIPESWQKGLISELARPDENSIAALRVARAFAGQKDFPADLRASIERVANDTSTTPPLRLAAFAAIPGKGKHVSPELFSLFMAELQSGDLSRAREAAVQLSAAELDATQVREIAQGLPSTNGVTFAALLEVFRSRRDPRSSEALLEQLPKIPSAMAPIVRSALASHPASVREAAELVFAKAGGTSFSARLQELEAALPKGDVRRGHLLFQNPRSACSTCHAMAYTGGTLGPDLTKIGAARSERDLLEAIAFPSMSFVRSYEPVLVKTRVGAEHLGIVKKEDAQELILKTGPQTEVRLARDEVQNMDPAPVSLMPQGYDGIFTPQELADLVAFLKAAK